MRTSTPGEFIALYAGAVERERAERWRSAMIVSAMGGGDVYAIAGEQRPPQSDPTQSDGWGGQDDADRRREALRERERIEAELREADHRDWLPDDVRSLL